MVLCGVLVHELNESVEDGLLAMALPFELGGLQTKEVVVVMHLCGHQTADRGAVVVGLADDVPEGIDDMQGGGYIGFAHGQLEVLHLTIECRWQLTWRKGYRKGGGEADAVDLQVGRDTDGADDGAWTDEDECAGRDAFLHQVEHTM